MGVGGQHHAPAALPPGNETQFLLRSLDGPHGLFGRVRNILLQPGFDSRTDLPVTISKFII
jgi:hypothetical protein